jgi:hypothetical protein
MGPLDVHWERLQGRFPQARLLQVNGSGALVTVPEIGLPAGWNKTSSAIRFLAPQGYPFAKPDCFWADGDLRLASGAIPQASNASNPVPGDDTAGLWFSWHTDHWNASRDDLLTWLASIRERLGKVQ